MPDESAVLGDRIVEQAAHIDAAMQRLLADIRAFDASGAWALEGMQSCAHWLSWRVGWSLAVARDRVRVARGLGEFPAMYAIELGDDGRPRFCDAAGAVVAAALGWPTIRAQNAGRAIDARARRAGTARVSSTAGW